MVAERNALLDPMEAFTKMEPSQKSTARISLVRFGKMLHRQGFVSGTDGNLSVRLDQDRVLVTPTGMSKALMKPEHMVVVSLDGKKLTGKLCPSSELPMHLAIYKLRPDVTAVVHAHPCYATGFASAGIALDEPLCSEVVISLGKVPLAAYANPGTQEVCEVLAPLIGEHDAILMSNHGVVTYGEDLLTAYLKMESVEHFARIVVVAKQLGHPRLLSAERVEYLNQARLRYRSAARA